MAWRVFNNRQEVINALQTIGDMKTLNKEELMNVLKELTISQ